MSVTQQSPFIITREVEWDAINSAVRIEMLVFAVMIGPCSIRELAELMGRPADGLYHHMRKLIAAGLIVEVGTRKAGTQTEAVYNAVAREITIDRNLKRKRTRERISRLFRTIIQHAQRTMEAALQSQEAVLDGEHQNVKLNWVASWLDEDQLAKIQAHEHAINEILQDGLKERKGRLFAVLTYLAPIIRTRGSENPSA